MIVYGAGGLGREVAAELGTTKLAYDPLWMPATWPDKSEFVVAVGDGRLRETMAARALAAGHSLQWYNGGNYSPPKPLMPGVLILKSSILTVDIAIGTGVLVNVGAMVSHDCVLGDWCSIQPGANLSVCRVGRYAYIGMGANIVASKKGEPVRVIGEGAIVGSGAVVTHDVEPWTIVAGVPARKIGEVVR